MHHRNDEMNFSLFYAREVRNTQKLQIGLSAYPAFYLIG